MDPSSTLPKESAIGNALSSIAASQLCIRLIDRYSTGLSGSISCVMQQRPGFNHDVVGIKCFAVSSIFLIPAY